MLKPQSNFSDEYIPCKRATSKNNIETAKEAAHATTNAYVNVINSRTVESALDMGEVEHDGAQDVNVQIESEYEDFGLEKLIVHQE